mmetsp:Transcript_28614/g.81285  ORF Transcript_28614/g.81285 Transcript_28614/m.81285 type:complete len:942 (-) Transcript_28614:162-2987(-)
MAETNPDPSSDKAPLLDVEGGAAASVTRVIAKFGNQNKRFKANATMALSIAMYMTLFGLPVFSSNVSYALFGQKDSVIGDRVVSVCGPNMMGPKVNIGNDTDPILVNYNTTWVEKGVQPYAWCGVLPGSYFGMWPTVVQTAMFTLYGTTGSTVKNAWQCIAGTFLAVVNVYVLTFLFPEGAKDPHYSPAIAWVNLTGVLFLFLASRADVNTMMMGMCSTVCLMLHFMDPNTGPTIGTYKTSIPIPFFHWDGETTMAMVTNIMGCIIAIAATLFPRPLLNITHVHDDAKEVIRAVDMIFKDSIDYYCSSAPDPRRFQIFGKMAALQGTVDRVKLNLDASFWETFNLGKFAKVRELYGSFNSCMANTQDNIYSVKSALMQLRFDDHHAAFVEALREPLKDLHMEVMDVLQRCANFCQDGAISAEEKEQIKSCVGRVVAKQQVLSKKFQEVASKSKDYICDDIAPDSLFVFAVSQWAVELQEWADDVAVFENKWRRKACCDAETNICAIAVDQFKNLFDASFMFSKSSLIYFLMNAIPILVGYAISMYSAGSIFVQYSSTIPSTLSLLVSYDSGATFFINLQKLMGVTFGHTLPLLVMSVVELFPCESYFRFAIHGISIFLFYSSFTFMYYASAQWSTIGIMVGAFGCSVLFRPCMSHISMSDNAYASHYKDIAEVIIAMMLKMSCAYIFSPKEPRDIAMDKLRQMFDAIETAFAKLSTGELESEGGVIANIKIAKGLLAECEAQAPKTDPKLQVVPGLRTPFKKELYEGALSQTRLIISDLDMLVLALKGHTKKHTLKHAKLSLGAGMAEEAKKIDSKREEIVWTALLVEQQAWKALDADLQKTIKLSFGACTAVLQHDDEEQLKSEHVDSLVKTSNLLQLDGMQPFYKEVSSAAQKEVREDKDAQVTSLPRTRILLAVNALALATKHSAELAAKSFEHMLYF